MNNGKVRIYELSKELNLDNKDIKEICEQLNIAVKSHSSTITASDAERVKTVAAKSPRAEKTSNSVKKGAKVLKASPKRKQQILAVHHRTDNPSTDNGTTAKSNGTPKLVAPPSRPTKPPKPGTISGQSAKPPAKPPQLDSIRFR